ncbi:dihydrofolate reductase family protein [Phytoactinopolyspora limicola]|uniref:dihydrofolate reductase family protein n=1 Tax=Phytoactinopolyspora limicola TaxID=2715536 RepID=UPI00140D6C27|nr:dihydrofolate reductase family protein [Phytoactinopolyspora limicola]
MGNVVVFNNLTLDGVMQAPGRPDEDRRGGFAHGGWSPPYGDEVMGRVMAEGMAEGGPILLGRRTYEDFFSYWPKQQDNQISDVLTKTPKYVASRTLTERLPWENSTLVADAVATVPRLKAQESKDITVLGSGNLLTSLMRHNLVDRYILLIHPLVLGSGQRMFGEGDLARLRLVDSVSTTTGVMIATYEPVSGTGGARAVRH